jgi:6,7-dimethyl-8-ribityllumazine synthase
MTSVFLCGTLCPLWFMLLISNPRRDRVTLGYGFRAFPLSSSSRNNRGRAALQGRVTWLVSFNAALKAPLFHGCPISLVAPMKDISLQKHQNTDKAEAAIRKKTLAGNFDASGLRFGIVVSRFNEFITDRLLRSAYDGLLRSGAREKDIDIVRVPGSFEIPSAARTLAETKKYDAIICLGCLIRGDTAHYDVIVNEVTRGIGQSAQETGIPHAFGVLTCENLEQAIDRAGLKMGNKGLEAALAAIEMANLKKAVSPQPSAVSKTVVGRSSVVVGKSQTKSPKTRSRSSRRKPKR